MPYERPTLQQLFARVQADFENNLGNSASRQRNTFEYASAFALAGVAHSVHGHVQKIGESLFPDVAEPEFLLLWANIYGLTRIQPSAASIDAQFTGDPLAAIPLGTQVQGDNGVVYETTLAGAIPAAGGSTIINIQATIDFLGTQGNVPGGTVLSLVTPVPNIDTEVIVPGLATDIIGGAADLETIEALRIRLLERMREVPSGGGPGDYIMWSKEVAGVSRAWEFASAAIPGTVNVYFVQDIFNSDGTFDQTVFPGAPEIAAVQAYLDARAPITAIVVVDAPVEVTLDPSIQLEPNTATVQQQVENQLQDLILRKAEPGGTLLLSEINEAISIAQGETDHILVSPVANVTVANNELLTLGTIIFAPIP